MLDLLLAWPLLHSGHRKMRIAIWRDVIGLWIAIASSVSPVSVKLIRAIKGIVRRTSGETAQVTIGLSQILLFIIALLANKVPRRSIKVP